MTQTVPYAVVSTTTIKLRKDGSVSFWKGVIDRGNRHQTVTASNKIGQAAILSSDEKTVWLPAEMFNYSDVANARAALVENAKNAVRRWDGLDILVLQAAFIAAREYCTTDEMEMLAYEPCLRGQGWQGEVPQWKGIVAADVNGLALVWSDTDFVDVRQIPVTEDNKAVAVVTTPPKYLMRPADITFHYREVCSYLTRHDIDAEARAIICGLAEQTIKQYGALDGTTAHRKVPLGTLNILREAAVKAYWAAAEGPYRKSAKILNGNDYIVPTLIALRADGSMCERHPHPLRVRERADTHGGYVIDISGAPSTEVFDEAAELRSRWRNAAYKCDWQPTEGYITVEKFLCAAADCCPYSLWRIGNEFGLWAIQPTEEMVERHEDAIHELEMPEKGVAA